MQWIRYSFSFLVCLFLFSSCETPLPPLGGKVDKEKSDHFYKGFTRRKIYCKRRLTNMSLFMVRYEPVELAHAKTFTVIDEYTGYDKYGVHYRKFWQKNIDRASFYVNPYGLVCDNNGVYTPHYCRHEYRMFPVEGADPATFRLLTPLCIHVSTYLEFGKDDAAVFLRKRTGKSDLGVTENSLFEKQPMDAASFEILNHRIVADKDSIYFVTNSRLLAQRRMPGRLEAIGPYVLNGDSIYQIDLIEDACEVSPLVENDSVVGYVSLPAYKVYGIEVKDTESVYPEFDVATYSPESYGDKLIWIDGKLYNRLEIVYEGDRSAYYESHPQGVGD